MYIIYTHRQGKRYADTTTLVLHTSQYSVGPPGNIDTKVAVLIYQNKTLDRYLYRKLPMPSSTAMNLMKSDHGIISGVTRGISGVTRGISGVTERLQKTRLCFVRVV